MRRVWGLVNRNRSRDTDEEEKLGARQKAAQEIRKKMTG